MPEKHAFVPSNRFEKSDNCLFREIDGEGVILNLDDENYYGLNATGVEIWTALDSGCSLDAAVEKLLLAFDVSEDEARADAMALVGDLVARGILLPVE